MIELRRDTLEFSFPEVHPAARLGITFHRTLRIPDDGRDYPLPPSLGAFPVRHVDDCAARAPRRWVERGGILLPMFQAEALWLSFDAHHDPRRGVAYPFAIKVAAGKINAASGEDWREGLHRDPQDYLVAPEQPWLDGYCVEKGFIRQFVAMPLGAGISVEEQLTGAAEHGGVQIQVHPMRRTAYERRFPIRRVRARAAAAYLDCAAMPCACAAPDMGLGAGGRMRQEVYEDGFDLSDWDHGAHSRCFVHLCNALVWRSLTGEDPPHPPPTAADYTRAGLPWFEYYGEGRALPGGARLAGVASVATVAAQRGQVVLPENEPVSPETIVALRRGLLPGQVRESRF